MNDELYDVKQRVKKEMCELCKKAPMSDKDVENLYKLMDVYKDAITSEAMNKYGESSYDEMYSSDMMARRSMDGSFARGRSATTGRFVSRDDGRSMGRMAYDDGYSGHSIKDRMIDRLERMMDEAKNDYERDEIRREIEEIRMKK